VIETHLRKAIQQEEFTLLYQPQIDITSGLIVGAEALIRWQSGTLGMMLPDRFIPVAENTGQIVEIGEWVLQEACNKIKMLQSCDDLPDTFQKISVNISAVQFRQENFVDRVCTIIEESGIDASFLEFELTEGALIDYIEEAIEKINILKKTGLTFSIDDFGTGFSSLAYLKKFPIDILKIDKSFVQDMDIDMDDAILTETIIQMSKNLKLGVIAEGVEKVEHLDFLKERGCQMYQGYFFSEPIDFDLFIKLLLNEEESISKTLLVKV
jgi:EAL domain-containing protein (putative c-di-GMP-specific phosphodiesterase class I)